MGLSLYEIIVVVFCLLLALAGFVYSMIKKNIYERKLKQTEFVAELDILTEKLLEKQEQKKKLL